MTERDPESLNEEEVPNLQDTIAVERAVDAATLPGRRSAASHREWSRQASVEASAWRWERSGRLRWGLSGLGPVVTALGAVGMIGGAVVGVAVGQRG